MLVIKSWPRPAMVLCALWIVGVVGCDEVPIAPATDAGIVLPGEDAAAPPIVDAGPPGECASSADCDDGNRCTVDTCMDGECWVSREPGCAECGTDADCDDAFRCSSERCVAGLCQYDWSGECECLDDTDCEDGDPTTGDRCVSYRCVHESRTCASDADCDDANRCTTDRCVDTVCGHDPIVGCGGTCPDRDGDGHGSSWCVGGDDCDDTNPAVHPGATEDCSNSVDDDCDGRVDAVDSDCGMGGDTCAAARPLTPGVRLEGAVIHDPSGGSTRMPCGAPNFFTLALTETSDVEVTVTLMEPPPPTPVPGCPECTADRMWEYWFRLFLETTCGDTTTDLGGVGSYCRSWSSRGGFFPGSPTETLTLRRVPAGSYTVELQASDFFGWMPTAIRYSIDATVTPSAAPMCSGATSLTEGTATRGSTASGVDAFGLACSGGAVRAEESIHTFTLTERRRVRLEVAGVPDPTSGTYPGMRVGIYGTCDPGSVRLECLEHTGYDCHRRSTIETFLDVGTYWAAVEGQSGGVRGYDLTLRTEAVGAACAGAPVISASGMTPGTTAGAPDTFRDPTVCGDGYGADVVYRVDVPVDQRVVLDLIATYSNGTLTLFTGCGETWVAGGRGRSRIDTRLTAGSYVLAVGGENEVDEGSFILNATFVP